MEVFIMKSRAQLSVLSPQETVKSKYYKMISKSKVMGNAAYSLDWTYIFSSIDQYIKRNKKNQCVILDVGCGNSMFHLFLEDYLRQGIVGIDIEDCTLQSDKLIKMGHVLTHANDLCLDFIDNTFFKNNVDIIYWNSSIEHNTFEGMRKAVNASLKALKPGGIFIATWAFAPKTHWNKSIGATVLSKKDAANLFKGNWTVDPDFDGIVSQYKSNVLGLNSWHSKRFGHDKYEFIHAGSLIEKLK